MFFGGDRTVLQSIPKTPKGVAIVPTARWVFNGKGEVTLIAQSNEANSNIMPILIKLNAMNKENSSNVP